MAGQRQAGPPRHRRLVCGPSRQVEFPPDLCSRVTFVNFTVTRSSLQSQCLNEVLKAERPDVDEKRSDLLKLQGTAWRVRVRVQVGLGAAPPQDGVLPPAP